MDQNDPNSYQEDSDEDPNTIYEEDEENSIIKSLNKKEENKINTQNDNNINS